MKQYPLQTRQKLTSSIVMHSVDPWKDFSVVHYFYNLFVWVFLCKLQGVITFSLEAKSILRVFGIAGKILFLCLKALKNLFFFVLPLVKRIFSKISHSRKVLVLYSFIKEDFYSQKENTTTRFPLNVPRNNVFVKHMFCNIPMYSTAFTRYFFVSWMIVYCQSKSCH